MDNSNPTYNNLIQNNKQLTLKIEELKLNIEELNNIISHTIMPIIEINTLQIAELQQSIKNLYNKLNYNM
jgi:peptidoglycan hydrolase CwlO-like protein